MALDLTKCFICKGDLPENPKEGELFYVKSELDVVAKCHTACWHKMEQDRIAEKAKQWVKARAY